MTRLTLIFTFFLLLCPANIVVADAATIDPYKGRWRVDMKRTLENFRNVAPQNIPAGGFPKIILKSMKRMSLVISRRRYVFRAGRRKVINSKFEIISLSDDGVMIRINLKNNIREQLLVLSPNGRLRVIAMTDGKPEPRASANHFIWRRVARIKKPSKPAVAKPETAKPEAIKSEVAQPEAEKPDVTKVKNDPFH